MASNMSSIDDYLFVQKICEGTTSTVYKALNKAQQRCLPQDYHVEYAIKAVDIEEYERAAESEINALCMLSDVQNGIVKLKDTFKDGNNVYIVLSFGINDLYGLIQNMHYVKRNQAIYNNVARHYASELVLAVEAIHNKCIVHRDLKPENILIEQSLHLAIADFGTAEFFNLDGLNNNTMMEGQKTDYVVGTAEYVSPEVMNHNQASKASDLWALGCIIYEMVAGLPPFSATRNNLVEEDMSELNLKFPKNFPADFKDLVEKLLVMDPLKRLGVSDKNGRYDSIRNHEAFKDIVWDSVWEKIPSDVDSVWALNTELQEPYWLLDIKPETMVERLEKQDRFGRKCEGELILHTGFFKDHTIMMQLTTGPRLFLFKINKGETQGREEIPWSQELRAKIKKKERPDPNTDVDLLIILTPIKKYAMRPTQCSTKASEWVKIIDEVRLGTYGPEL